MRIPYSEQRWQGYRGNRGCVRNMAPVVLSQGLVKVVFYGSCLLWVIASPE
jgi:hypothetical protein